MVSYEIELYTDKGVLIMINPNFNKIKYLKIDTVIYYYEFSKL